MDAAAPRVLGVALAAQLISPLVDAETLEGLPGQAAEGTALTPAGEAYVDRVLQAGSLDAFPADADDDYDDQGLPRSWSVDANAGSTAVDGRRQSEYGVSASGYWETAAWGSYSLLGGLYKSFFSDTAEPIGTLWQRGLNLDGGWQLDNGLGVVNTPLTALQRAQTRFFLPAAPVLGFSSEWNRAGGVQLMAATGTPGQYQSGRLSGFDAGSGRTDALAADLALGQHAEIALAYLANQDRATGDGAFDVADAESIFAGGAWQQGPSRMQLNLLSTDYGSMRIDDPGADPAVSSARGGWLDLGTQQGRYQHDIGVYHFDPELSWGGEPMNSDADGGYYRIGHQKMRWSWGGSVDYLRPVTVPEDDSVYGSGNVRYQARSATGIGGSATVRSGSRQAHRVSLFGDQRTSLGISRVQFDQAADGDDQMSWQVGFNQDFPGTSLGSLSTTLNYRTTERAASEEQAGATSRAVEAVLFGSRELVSRISLDGSVRGDIGTGPDAESGLFANLGVNWEIDSHWQLLATYNRSTARRANPFVLQPFPDPETRRFETDNESLFLTLRYSHQAGRRSGVLGGMPGSPAGLIKGTVFLDENADGRRNAGEQVVPNIAILLDGRFSTQTDAQGRFSFPSVVTGTHVIEASPDTLPLPWQFAPEASTQTIDLGVRDRVDIEIPARRTFSP